MKKTFKKLICMLIIMLSMFLVSTAEAKQITTQEPTQMYQLAVKTNIYTLPERKEQTDSKQESLDDILTESDDVLNSSDETKLDDNNFQIFISSIYGILLTIGILASVIVGAVLGVKYMTASIEGKATVKTYLLPYAVGCAILFGSFAIWKIAIEIFSNLG